MSMGGGSSGPSHNTSEVTQTNLPAYAEPYFRDLLARTGYETSVPYEAYQGQRTAWFSPMEQEAMARVGELGMSGTPAELNEAARMASMGGQGFATGIGVNAQSNYRAGAPPGSSYNPNSRSSQYTAGQLGRSGYYNANQRDVDFDPGSLADKEMLDKYMDPYMQSVVDIQKRETMRDADIRHQSLALDAAKQGSLGGYRDAILRSETERQLGQRLGDIQEEGSQQSFFAARDSFNQDRQARAQREAFQQSQFGMNEQARQRMAELVQSGFSMNEAARQAQEELAQGQFGMNESSKQFGAGLQLQAYQAYEQAKQAAAQMGLDAAQIEQQGQIAASQIMLGQQDNMLKSSQLLGGFADQREGMEMNRLNAMMGVGGMERGLIQQGLDTGYQDYLRQQAYGKEQLAFYNTMLHGLPVTPGSTTATYGQQPSFGQSLLGSGIAGLGMYQGMKG
jgi:hypothetical protein